MNRAAKSKLMASALYDAIQWRDSLAGANGYDSEEGKRNMQKVIHYRQLLNEMGYSEPEITGESISIWDVQITKED